MRSSTALQGYNTVHESGAVTINFEDRGAKQLRTDPFKTGVSVHCTKEVSSRQPLTFKVNIQGCVGEQMSVLVTLSVEAVKWLPPDHDLASVRARMAQGIP